MEARMELTLKNGARYVVWADVAKLKKLKIALARRMENSEHEMVNVCGVIHEDGATRPVDLSIMTDQLAGVELTVLDDVGRTGSRTNATTPAE